ncbi:hypothetical protein [Litorihabitans aurantiacus]|uniref:Integral membrane protein n=1 Tax=Litorihabitans aurantiacus TaxID=1930061 RepID=A0AA37XE27_9MICO|nr:hypothetical protein [Litorihabitans aurantiacus]GMA31499.1 hypothetical protein GCM10025875_14910 [Litorihabitans aurantiacus]
MNEPARPDVEGPHDGADPRPRAYGAGRALVAVYGVLALAATARSLYQLGTKAGEAPVPYALSALAAVVYVVATIALAHNGTRMRRVAWVCVVVELVGVVSVGLWSYLEPSAFPEATVWSHLGQGYGFVPAVLPVLGLVWLWRSDPGRRARAEIGTRTARSAS